MNKKTTIQSIRNQDERVVQRIYTEFKPKFINWLKGKYKIGEQEDCNEIYQRSFTVLYFNIKKGKLDDLEASLETYLFGVGKLVLKEWWREKGSEDRSVAIEAHILTEKFDLLQGVLNGPDQDFDRKQKLAHSLETLGDPCKTILKLFYWERNSMEAIAIKTGYKNEQGAKKKKYLCLEKLKNLMMK